MSCKPFPDRPHMYIFLPKAYKTRELKEKDVCMSGLLLVSPTVLFLIYYDREDVRVGVEAE